MSVLDTSPVLNRTERRKLQTRERLKQATLELLYERGYPNITIQAITERADLGYGTFYLHYQDKDDLVWEVLLDSMEQDRQKLDAALADTPHPQKEYLSWVELFRIVQAAREAFLVLYGRHGSATLSQRFQDYLAQVHFDNLTQEVYYNPMRGVPYECMAQFAAGALMRMMFWYAETPNDYTPEDMAAMMFEMFYHRLPQTESRP